MKRWKKWPIQSIRIDNSDFPEQLKAINQCPHNLYYRGYWNSKLFQNSLAIVGSRRMTRYGQSVIERFMPELVGAGVTIISGFMYGVDTESHKTCLDNGGKTVAVLASGLDYLNPIGNDALYSEILNKGGLVISEYEADFKATLWSFPQRNRIVSGLANKGVLVVEATTDSGSLVTAKFAEKQGKILYAIPGPISQSTSEGTNWLIKSGKALMVTETNDILHQNKSEIRQLNLLEDLDKEEIEIVNLLEAEGMAVDELCRKLKKSVPEIGSRLSMLGIKGKVQESNGYYYIKK